VAHVFRFFVDVPGAGGDVVALDADDAAHLRVLRGEPGATVEVVDGAGVLWSASVQGKAGVQLQEALPAPPPLPEVMLYAGMLTGQRWDALVDGAVQAGVARVVPVVERQREVAKVAARLERSRRVARAAAKQSKRMLVPEVGEPIVAEQLVDEPPGFVLALEGSRPLLEVPRPFGLPVSLLVGGAEGLDRGLVATLVAAGWQPVLLGRTVLRSELAAPVGVATVLQVLGLPQGIRPNQ
jgi:16S rRNA (uracil1498-N3)-methyltransferase